MVRGWSRASAVLLAWCALTFASPAYAQSKVSRLAKQLEDAEDFRVRTQAALALGASKSKSAVKPLCKALRDSNTTVRAAAAAALGKLAKGGESCLEKRLAKEKSSSVKSVIRKSLAKMEDSAPSIDSSTKYYVAIAEVSDKTERGGTAIERLTRKTLRKHLSKQDGFVVAPKDETKESAKALLAKHSKVTGFFLTPKVRKPSYAGGNLKVKVQVTVFTYPGKALKGMIPKSLTQQGVDGPDEDTEDELISMAFERALSQFLDNISKFE